MLTLHLVRHGSHDLVGQLLCGADHPVTLNQAGRRQARAAARWLGGQRIDLLATSPAARARDTAGAIGALLAMRAEPEMALAEIDFGAWAGARFAELDPLPDWQRWNSCRATARPPGGERMVDVQARLVAWLAGLPAHGTVAAVSHADVIKALVALALDLSLDRHDRLEIGCGSITTITRDGAGLRLVRLGDLPDD